MCQNCTIRGNAMKKLIEKNPEIAVEMIATDLAMSILSSQHPAYAAAIAAAASVIVLESLGEKEAVNDFERVVADQITKMTKRIEVLNAVSP